MSTSELLEAVKYRRKELNLRCLLESLNMLLDGVFNTWKIGMTSKQNWFHCQDIKKKLLNISFFSKEPRVVFLQLSQFFFCNGILVSQKRPEKAGYIFRPIKLPK